MHNSQESGCCGDDDAGRKWKGIIRKNRQKKPRSKICDTVTTELVRMLTQESESKRKK